jgi:AcrR family transcriptional regulator
VGEICDAAGIAKGTFYRYFDSKDAIFVAAARSTVEAVGEALDRRGGTLSETEALSALQALLAPLAPLLLEAATRELRDEPKSAGIVASVAQGLAARLRPRLGAQGAIPAARKVVETVILGLVRPALGLR